jgi:hypothetical protein
MRERINKPRVFLSHSAKDKDFIEKRLAMDLRKCQIDYWLDTEEIRDGSSWLKMIFQDGIPVCDVVIVYLTEYSITSPMVEKEMDAALIGQLSDSGIVLLPYVNKGSLRGKLRSDIRSLHCREWNEDNYHDVLPSVVAEVWHSYLEKVVSMAVTQEKNKRLEVELEYKRLQERFQGSPFSPSEEKEFRHIYDHVNIQTQAIITDKELASKVKFNLLEMLIRFVDHNQRNFFFGEFKDELSQFVTKKDWYIRFSLNMDDISERILLVGLLTYGLVGVSDSLFTDKMYRFRYWLEYHHLLSANISFEVEQDLSSA